MVYKNIKYILLLSSVITILLINNNIVGRALAINFNNVDPKTIISIILVFLMTFVVTLCFYLIWIGLYRKQYVLMVIGVSILVVTLILVSVLLVFMPFISWRIWGFAP